MINAILIEEKDNVIVAIEPIKKGDEIIYLDKNKTQHSLKALEDITIYHKIARKDIKKDDYILKYSEHIGKSKDNIKAGEHIHCHNVIDNREKL